MKKIRIFYYLSIIFLLTTSLAKASNVVKAFSPNGKVGVELSVCDGQICYSVLKDSVLLLDKATLSMNVDGRMWGHEKAIKRKSLIQKEETVTFPVPRKYTSMDFRYTVLVLAFRGYDIEFRIYDEGVAYRFVGKQKRQGKILSENVNYRFTEDALAYTQLTDKLQNWYEEKMLPGRLSSLPEDKFSIMPVLLKTKGKNVLLGEADLYDYSGMYLRKSPDCDRTLQAVFSYCPSKEEYVEWGNKRYAVERENYIVSTSLCRTFPWRIIGVYDTDEAILSSELVYAVSQKSPCNDFSWIKPGQALWDWWNDRNVYHVDFEAGINTAYYCYLIDVASEYGIPYILIDEGWSRNNNLLDLNPDVDMAHICEYAETKGVGVLLWAKWVDVDRQLEEFFDELDAWKVKGVKIDFMDRNDVKMVAFYERVAEAAARHHLLVDFHGSYPSEGMRAKYPNLLTREGVVGLEYNKMKEGYATPKHDCTIPFIRMWAGPMDYTPGAMLNEHEKTHYRNHHEPMSMGTRCHQIAMYVVYESPLQMLSDSPTKYLQNKECFKFMTLIPTVWDNTVVLESKIGEFAGFAREKDGIWYVGYIGGEKAVDLEVCLSFLPEGEYEMEIFRDGINVERNAEDYVREFKSVNSSDSIGIHLGTGGGFAARIIKK